MKKILIASLIVIAVFAVYAYKIINTYLHTPLMLTETNDVILVESGSSLKTVAKQLQQMGVLPHPDWLSLYARVTKKTMIRTGEYLLKQGMTPLQLLSAMNKGDVVHHQITLVEGKTFNQTLTAILAEPKLHKSLNGLPKQILIERLGVEGNSLEGLFFPDTYQYTVDMSDADILKQAYKKMKLILDEEWQARDNSLPYKNSYEALIMASIVEKETGAPEERSAIAGVFVRRLQKGMRLQTDPTVIYGLGEAYKGNLTRKHLLEDTPYNTYTRSGLPPTPIALAGREAIHAAMHPQKGDSLFFVGRGDGHHYFSATLAEHEKAVRQYQLTRKKDYHSAPSALPNRAK